ncbi:MAG: hypothetical protein ACYTG6_17080 [Planctomycetota bacterium]
MRLVLVSIGLAAVLACGGPAQGEEGRILTRDVAPENVEVRLTGAAISPRRGRNLRARFVPVDPAEAEEIVIVFPAHSHTTHETTLMNVIRASLESAPAEGRSEDGWTPVRHRAVFSTPQDDRLRNGDLHRTYFVRFDPLDDED